MKRRNLLQSLAAVPAAASAAQSTARPPASDESPRITVSSLEAAASGMPRFFNASQLAALSKLAGAILPTRNGRPGATQAGVVEFLDFLVGQSPADVQSLYRDGLDHLSHEGVNAQSLAPLTAAWTYQGPANRFAQFLQRAKADVFQATVSSREWAESQSRGSRAAAPSGYFWRSLD